jgi:hypothetical protein
MGKTSPHTGLYIVVIEKNERNNLDLICPRGNPRIEANA